MKFNKWTLGLAAVGAVSLTSVAQAEEKMMLGSQAAMTATTISGYVDTSAHWNIGRDNAAAPTGATKQDGFNLNVVQLTLSKALDESEWAAGYRADIWLGPDANRLNTVSTGTGTLLDYGIRQAYVALRTPVGNGIDWKMGVFDTIVGYETLESGNNPNYTRSLGFSLEPTTHTGLLGTYRFCDSVSASAGVVDSFGPAINGRNTANESRKTYMGSVALTAPSDWGWVSGSSLYLGAITGFDSSPASTTATGGGKDGSRDHYYAGVTLATPLAGLKVGACADYSHANHIKNANIDNTYVYGLYASLQATEKLSLHGRLEYQRSQDAVAPEPAGRSEATLTAQYDLWKNVISRLELRADHSENKAFTVNGGQAKSTYLAALNIIYKF